MADDIPDEIEIPVWVKRGNMLYSRACLPSDDPDSDYQYVKRELGLRPEEYGILGDTGPKLCPNCGYRLED